MHSLTLTSAEVIAAIEKLEGVQLPVRTLASWASKGVVVPSVSWSQQRGRWNNTRVYSLADLARARLVLHLRRSGVSMPKVRAIFAYLEADLREVLRPKTSASLVVTGTRAYVVRPGQPDQELPTGQLRLRLVDVVTGNQHAARDARRVA